MMTAKMVRVLGVSVISDDKHLHVYTQYSGAILCKKWNWSSI